MVAIPTIVHSIAPGHGGEQMNRWWNGGPVEVISGQGLTPGLEELVRVLPAGERLSRVDSQYFLDASEACG